MIFSYKTEQAVDYWIATKGYHNKGYCDYSPGVNRIVISDGKHST